MMVNSLITKTSTTSNDYKKALKILAESQNVGKCSLKL